jgi:choline dehydrogenase-like flavoprotein
VPAKALGVSLGASLLKPGSRGLVALVSPDPTAKPLIVHNYCAEPEDLRTLVAGMRLVMQLARIEPLAGCLSSPHVGRLLARRPARWVPRLRRSRAASGRVAWRSYDRWKDFS